MRGGEEAQENFSPEEEVVVTRFPRERFVFAGTKGGEIWTIMPAEVKQVSVAVAPGVSLSLSLSPLIVSSPACLSLSLPVSLSSRLSPPPTWFLIVGLC